MILISTALQMFAASFVLLPSYIILNKVVFHNSMKSIVYYIFSIYLVAVYALVGMPNITYIRFELSGNLVPIIGFLDDWRSSVLNVLLFIPLGIMLPIGWKTYRTNKNAVLFGLGMSLTIEILQIFTYRATDINDLITNGFGTFLGAAFANLLIVKFPIIDDLVQEKNTKELCLILVTVFAEMFFIQPFIFPILFEMVF